VPAAQAKGAVQAPRFEVDPLWPKPLPNKWILGQTIGVSVDAQDHVWIIHRAGSLEPGRGARHDQSADGAVLRAGSADSRVRRRRQPRGPLGRSRSRATTGPTRITASRSTTRATSGLAATAAAQAAPGGRARSAAAGQNRQQDESQVGGVQSFNDNMVLKFTRDGKFLMQIGKPRSSKGSNDLANLRLPAKTFLDKETNELYVADGYGNHRVIVFDADTGKYKRHWGAYGNKPDDVDLGRYDPKAPPAKQFRNPVHCADLSVDRLLYVCDRVNDRIQVFKPDGTFVKEAFYNKATLGSGSTWDVAFSRDPQQRYMYVADGENAKVHVVLRETLDLLTSFGEGGRQPGEFYGVHSLATDSKGNLYTTETYRGQRVQKFTYKGLAPVTKKDQGVVWPKS
jgi:DNA-binding beta-propeller fold protein YncE